ncbi:MATE family multidrug resistance protein [Sphingobium sp. B7D2B]|uniref:MATE family efflux transporter n=1 Tax=Sphingobium sp. B7D2B TaxID=2940583 RepID=UPI0022243BAF|nr:MATE family efflux transporter [Sphingobium sp. B7D2B]MCW2367647.1 MATE family multidrug resistance protein [Sphingobium sp. B7D2B]
MSDTDTILPPRHTGLLSEARRIAWLAWPIVLTNLNWTIMHLVDVTVVGYAGTSELGALAAGRVVMFVILMLLLAGMSGVIVFTSRADGGGDLHRTGALWREAVLTGLLLGVPSAVVIALFARPLLALTGVADALVDPGAHVLAAMMLGLPGQMLSIGCAYFLEGVSAPRRVLIVNLATLPVNAVLTWAMALGHLGFPAMGAFGAALATSLTSLGGGLAMAYMAWTLPSARERGLRRLDLAAWRSALSGIDAIVRFGAMPGIGAAMEVLGFSYLMILSTQMGEIVAGGFQVMLSLHNLGFALALGLGSAAGVRVGNAVGAGEPWEARSRTMIACGLSILFMGAVVLAYLLFGRPIVAGLTAQPAVAREALIMLLILAPFILCDGIQAIFVAALRSLGDQVIASVNGIIAFFGVMGVMGWYGHAQGWGSAGLAFAAALGMAAAMVLQAARFWQVSRRYRRT